MILQSFTIYDIIKRNARIYGKKTAITSGEKRTDYSTFLKEVNALASGLAAKGVGPGDRIGILALNHESFFHIFGAASLIGAVVSPVNWRLSTEEIRYILEDSSPSVLVVDQKHHAKIDEINGSGPFKMSPENIICFDAPGNGSTTIESLMKSDPVDFPDVSENDAFCIIYTAAVEGYPRGAVLTHKNIIAANMQFIAAWALNTSDSYLNMLPMFHITGLNLAMAAMHVGGKNVVVEKFNAKRAMELIQEEKITMLGSFAPIMSRLLEEAEKGDYNVSSLKNITGLESPEAVTGFQKKTGAVFWPLYGQTETSGTITLAPFDEKPGSAGKPALLSEIRMVDEFDNPTPTGEVGEIAVRGPLVFKGYWKQNELNRKTFRNDWHHTGDLGKFDDDGFLWFAGRKPEKELIKPGGENVYPAEVEEVILEHPKVVEVSVIGVPDPEFGEGIKAVCVLEKGASLEAKDLIEFVAQRIARYKKPRYVKFVDGLPKSASGEVDRLKVKQLYGKG